MTKLKTIKTTKITTYSDNYLISVIHLWNEYDTISVLIAYSELKRRNYSIPEYTSFEIIEFCKKIAGKLQDLKELFPLK